MDSNEQQANGRSSEPSISANGRFVVFTSSASNLVPGQIGSSTEIYVRDRMLTNTIRITAGRFVGVSWWGRSAISSDGRYVAFASYDHDLVPGTNNRLHVFVKDVETGTISRVSDGGPGVQGNDMSAHPSISCDGQYIAFHSLASNLVSGDTNASFDVFVRDRVAGTTSRVSVSSSGVQGNLNSAYPSISCDGRFVAFSSWAGNLVPGDTNVDAFGDPIKDIFVHDRQTATTTRVSVDSSGAQADGASCCAAISGDGRLVAFESAASNLVPGDTNNTYDVFVRDMQTGATTRVSTSSAGVQGNDMSGTPSLSHDGRYVAYNSWATNLVAGDSENGIDVFRHDRQTASVRRFGGNRLSYLPSISANGNVIAFTSSSTDLVTGDTNNVHDVFAAFRTIFDPGKVDVVRQFEWINIDPQRVLCLIRQSCPLPEPPGPDPLPWRFQADVPGWQRENFGLQLQQLYRAAAPLLRSSGKLQNPQAVTKEIAAALRKAPAGMHHTKEMRGSLLRDLEGLDAGRVTVAAMQGKVLAMLNAIELDARAGIHQKRPVPAGKTASVALSRQVSARFKDVAKGGSISVSTVNGLPAWVDGMAPSWPLLHYKVDFSGQLGKNGEVQLEFHVGDVAFSPLSLRRVFEWDGKAYRDVTVSYDPRRNVIIGRTRKPASYVIL